MCPLATAYHIIAKTTTIGGPASDCETLRIKGDWKIMSQLAESRPYSLVIIPHKRSARHWQRGLYIVKAVRGSASLRLRRHPRVRWVRSAIGTTAVAHRDSRDTLASECPIARQARPEPAEGMPGRIVREVPKCCRRHCCQTQWPCAQA